MCRFEGILKKTDKPLSIHAVGLFESELRGHLRIVAGETYLLVVGGKILASSILNIICQSGFWRTIPEIGCRVNSK